MSARRRPSRLRRVIAGIAATAAAVAAVFAVGGLASADTNTSAGHLVVYDNNVENMIPKSADCYGDDWNLLLSYVKRQAKSPDVFTIQQISDIGQLNALTKRLTDELPGAYAGRIAIEEPGSMGYTSRCGKMKNQQTNAVVYRTDRFTYEAATRWRSDAPANPKEGTGSCRNLERSSQDRVHNIAVRLHDRIANKDVTIASIHWPTNTWNAHKCADENMKEADEAVDRLGGSMKIIGGDTNATYGKKDWWSDADAFGFRDPIAALCGGPSCPSKHNTTANSRIDFLLVKHGHGFTNAATISESATGGRYSDHRAVTAYVKY